jgi:hypothetical protein
LLALGHDLVHHQKEPTPGNREIGSSLIDASSETGVDRRVFASD